MALPMAQAAFELIASRYPGAFAGYNMSVTESHQSSKVPPPVVLAAAICAYVRFGGIGRHVGHSQGAGGIVPAAGPGI